MNDGSTAPPDGGSPTPPDDLRRDLAVASPDEDQALPHVAVVGDTYTILLTGQDSAGRYALIDMHVPPGGGPPPHRHDFEEMFGANNAIRELGGVFGVAVLAAVFAAKGGYGPVSSSSMA